MPWRLKQSTRTGAATYDLKPWRLKQSTRSGAATSDLKGSRNMVIRKRDRRKDSAQDTELDGSGAITGSITGFPHPLVAIIKHLEAEEPAHKAESGDKTVEAAIWGPKEKGLAASATPPHTHM
ncbi:hypothetical protein NDU88_003425 [Pleurodeles waltl]|uniref:Uncharacterized protein n=1 Tax=Pleurodeles waltl TaxID=8319 RepID=A0AAV7KUX1_PLEWA|nr:hypothetical protein NDU88_003425 [Pleurodeles waltl]